MSRKKKKASNDSASQWIQPTLFDYPINQESNLNSEILEINSKVSFNITDTEEKLQDNTLPNVNEIQLTDAIKTDSLNEDELDIFDRKNIRSKPSERIGQLYIPVSYEEIVKIIDKKSAKIAELIVPITKFEKQITQVVNDIKKSGYLLFLYGASGVEKSTFISSLEWRTHIPIK